MIDDRATYATVLTPAGRGAIAVVLVSGPRAIEAVDAHFIAGNDKRLSTQPLNAIRFGHWSWRDGEEVIACRRTGNSQSPVVEIHCHGGHAAAAAIMDDLSGSECTPLAWRDWLQSAANDPIVADAWIALAGAPTERTAAILLDQFHGALSKAIHNVVAEIHQGDIESATRGIVMLLGRAELGQHLTAPWQVVLAGPPNVGKSSLINALLGYTRSIVFDQPGTTRDVVTARTAIDGWPVELADTAGLRSTRDALEAAGVEQATNVLARADLVIFVSDVTQPNAEVPRELEHAQRRLHLRNKIDLAPDAPPLAGVCDTSAVTGAGVEALLSRVANMLLPDVPAPGTAVLFTGQQQASLQAAQAVLAANDIAGALSHLQSLLAHSSCE
jgi:tRNA modification GTPase